MKRKYLDNINAKERPDLWGKNKEDKIKQEKWKKQRENYGFDERETWDMRIAFRCWLYERLKMFLEVNIIDINYHKFEYKGEVYTQKEIIDMILEKCEYCFRPEFDNWKEEDSKIENEIPELWALVSPAMWW